MVEITEVLIPQAFSPSLLAELLGVSKSTAYRLARDEKLSISVGGRKVIFRREYENWLLQKTVEANECMQKMASPKHNHSKNQAEPIQRHYA